MPGDREAHMNLRSISIFLCLLCAFAVSALSLGFPQSSDPSLPAAQQVLNRYAEVSGEYAHLAQHTSITIRGRYQDPSNKIEATLVSYSTKDGVELQKFHLTDGRSGASGFDGHVGWNLGLSGKVSIQTGDIALTMARDADMYYHLHVMQYFKSLENVGVEEFHGHTCYHLKGVNNWNQPNEQFYDKASGLLIGYKFNTAWRGGNGDADAIFEDYKPFHGILFATKETDHDGQDMTITYTDSVMFDTVLVSDLEPPPAVEEKLASRGSH
jgi:hypothetical protein